MEIVKSRNFHNHRISRISTNRRRPGVEVFETIDCSLGVSRESLRERSRTLTGRPLTLKGLIQECPAVAVSELIDGDEQLHHLNNNMSHRALSSQKVSGSR